jgi:hypothetical protein
MLNLPSLSQRLTYIQDGEQFCLPAEDMKELLDTLTVRTKLAQEWKLLTYRRDDELRKLQVTYAQLSESYHTLEHRLSALLHDVKNKFPSSVEDFMEEEGEEEGEDEEEENGNG